MSDDEREVEIESDEERRHSGGFLDKRAHHNALERKRRDHIKESFSGLRDAIPTMQGDKSSRAQILKKASEYISFMRKKNNNGQRELEDLKRQNSHLEAQIRVLERAKNTGQFSSAQEVLDSSGLGLTAQEASARMLASEDGGEDANMEDGAAGGAAAAVENGYDASGSDGSPSPAVQQQQHQEVVTTTPQPQQIHIQHIGGNSQQRVIQVLSPSGSGLGIRPGQSLLISSGQASVPGLGQANGEPLKKKMKN